MHRPVSLRENVARIEDDLAEIVKLSEAQQAEIIRLVHDNRELLKEVQRLRTTEAAS